MLRGDVADERDSVAEKAGPPTSTAVGPRGFRVYTWETASKTITLSGYPAGVIVTERVPTPTTAGPPSPEGEDFRDPPPAKGPTGK
jgi:hypothetical protein